MPEYLAPGVFIEEIPAKLKAIEGVSTSTAGMVGPAERGPVAGFPLPYDGTIDNFVVPDDPTPVLVTSFAEFTRQFGAPLPLPDVNENGYLARAVKGFFDNGGKRCFVARIVDNDAAGNPTATRSTIQLLQGTVLRLARRAPAGQNFVLLTSLRRVADGAAIEFRRRTDNSVIQSTTVSSYDTQLGQVNLGAAVALPAGEPPFLDPNSVYVRVAGVAPTANGPLLHARTAGAWSSRLTVVVASADRGPNPITATAAATDTLIQVQSAGSFYRGAIIEIDNGVARAYGEVRDILPGNQLVLAGAIGIAVTSLPDSFARVIEIDITVTDESSEEPAVETFKALTWNPRNETEVRRRHYATILNTRSRLVYAQPPGVDGLAGSEAADIDTQPTTANGFPMSPTTLGDDGASAPDADDYIGVDNGPGNRTGIQSLQDIEDIRIIAAPGRTEAEVHNALISQAERLRYRFAVLDGERDPAGGSVNAVLAHRNLYDTSFAAYYTPWVEVTEQGQRLQLPPSGHVVGVYARTDVERGVHKAPANEVVRGVVGLRSYITTGEQEVLNPRGVNCIRRFEGRGIRVWGARTLSSDPEFRYVNVRRVLIFLEASIDRGTQYVVFEPNDPGTWSRVVDSVGAFLHTQWRNGLLFGRKPEDAFFVRCDETTMSADDVQNGRLICLIGVSIVRPAEFVIFRIQQLTGFANQP